MIVLLIVGGIVAFVGWILLIIGAFRTSVWWGLAVLVGPIILGFAIRNVWANAAANLALILAFALPRWDDVKTGLIVYVAGSLLCIPGALGVMKQAEKAIQEQAAVEEEKARKVQRVYTPPSQPVIASAAAPTQTATPPPPANDSAYPGIKMTAVAQVYVINSPKTYYPIDCKARPDNAYKMARSLALKQGYKLAAECGKEGT